MFIWIQVIAVGELSDDGSITVKTHLWDSKLGGWVLIQHFDQTIKQTSNKKTLPQSRYVWYCEKNKQEEHHEKSGQPE